MYNTSQKRESTQWQKQKEIKEFAPFPIELLARHSAALALPSAGSGMVTRILIYYWLTDCRPLPKNITELCGIARAHKPTFALYRQDLLLVINDLAPDFKNKARILLAKAQ
jgi:hypothetical protein